MTSYYRNVMTAEVLSDRPLDDAELHSLDILHALITDGDCSGRTERTEVNEQLTAARMAELLIAQGSDPEFLIQPDDESLTARDVRGGRG